MKVLVLGSSGIIGQHMRAAIPSNVDPIFARRKPSTGYMGVELTNQQTVHEMIVLLRPQAVINLAGESNTDEVERNPRAYWPINVGLPEALAEMPENIRLVHVSSQAVFGGRNAPYRTISTVHPINEYGKQKAAAEALVLRRRDAVVVRPTFVLGIRPDPAVGRENPVEQMLGGQRKQVCDRWFSVSFAPDVAACIWSAAMNPDSRRIIHAGIPIRTSRYKIACDLSLMGCNGGIRFDVEPVSHDDFSGLAPRPLDTTFAGGEHRMGYFEGLADCLRRWEALEAVAA